MTSLLKSKAFYQEGDPTPWKVSHVLKETGQGQALVAVRGQAAPVRMDLLDAMKAIAAMEGQVVV